MEENNWPQNGLILDPEKWNVTFRTINLWLAALIRCKMASRYEVDCVLDIIMDNLKQNGIIQDTDHSLDLLRRTMTFAFFAGKCFADKEQAASAAAKSAPRGKREQVYMLVLKNFEKAKKGFINNVEYRIRSFMDVYKHLPSMPKDKDTFIKRQQSLKHWNWKFGEDIVPEIE